MALEAVVVATPAVVVSDTVVEAVAVGVIVTFAALDGTSLSADSDDGSREEEADGEVGGDEAALGDFVAAAGDTAGVFATVLLITGFACGPQLRHANSSSPTESGHGLSNSSLHCDCQLVWERKEPGQ